MLTYLTLKGKYLPIWHFILVSELRCCFCTFARIRWQARDQTDDSRTKSHSLYWPVDGMSSGRLSIVSSSFAMHWSTTSVVATPGCYGVSDLASMPRCQLISVMHSEPFLTSHSQLLRWDCILFSWTLTLLGLSWSRWWEKDSTMC